MRIRNALFALALAPGLAVSGCAAAESKGGAPDCRIGAYRLADGRVLDVGPSSHGALRWRLSDGVVGRLAPDDGGALRSTLGWTNRPDGVSVAFDCEARTVSFAGVEGRMAPMNVVETIFKSADGTPLKGRLVLPPGDGPVPVLVQVHGSERDSALLYEFRQRMFPAQGVGVFVYDKRGTGGSGGRYTQDFETLARDGAAAVAEARRLADVRASRLGVGGGSQGGWVGPLVASRTPVDFVVVGFGLAVSPAEEDASEVQVTLQAKGYGPDVLAKAKEVTDATAEVMASGFRQGFDELDRVKRKYGAEPWFRETGGEYTPELLKHSNMVLRVAGPSRDLGTPWRHDPMPVLRALEPPVLWTLAGADTEAPPEETHRRLRLLQAEGKPITIAEFPGTEHNLFVFETGADGHRTPLRYAPGAFDLELQFIREGEIQAADYPTVVVEAPVTPEPLGAAAR